MTATWKVVPTTWFESGGTTERLTGAGSGRGCGSWAAGSEVWAPVRGAGGGVWLGIWACWLSWPTMEEAATAAVVLPLAGRGRGMMGTLKSALGSWRSSMD